MRAAKAMRRQVDEGRQGDACREGDARRQGDACGEGRSGSREGDAGCQRSASSVSRSETPRSGGAFPFSPPDDGLQPVAGGPARCATGRTCLPSEILALPVMPGRLVPSGVVERDDRDEALGPLGGPQERPARPVRGARQVVRRRADLDDRAVEDVAGTRRAAAARPARPCAGTESSRSLIGISAFRRRAVADRRDRRARRTGTGPRGPAYARRQDAARDRAADRAAGRDGVSSRSTAIGRRRRGLSASIDARGVAGLALAAGLLAQGRSRAAARRRGPTPAAGLASAATTAPCRTSSPSWARTSTIVPSSGASRRTSVQGRRTASVLDRPRGPRDREHEQQDGRAADAGTSARVGT